MEISDALAEFRAGLRSAMERVKAVDSNSFEEERFVGRKRLPTTVGGLIVHCAEHTQRAFRASDYDGEGGFGDAGPLPPLSI